MLLIVSTNPAIDRTLDVPHLRVGGVQRAGSVYLGAGGKGLNVARAARILGQPYLVMGYLAGHSGALVAELAQAEGLHTRWLDLSQGETRHCLLLNHQGGDTTVINEPGPEIKTGDWAHLEGLLDELGPQSGGVAFAGSLPPSVSGQAYSVLCHRLRARVPGPLFVDTSTDHLKAVVDDPGGLVLKINRGELCAALGRAVDLDLRQACQALVDRGATAVIVTSGDQGILAVTSQGSWTIQPPLVSGGSSVGSGDSFLAGLATGLLQGQPWPEALTLAAACGAANAATPLPAHFSLDDVHRLRALCQAQPLP